jgi:hypothetical protein
MITAASARPGRAEGIEVYDLPTQYVTRAELVFRGIEHGDTSYEVRIFLNAPDADGDTPRTVDAGYAGHVSVSGHGHHTGTSPSQPRAPIDVIIDVTDAFHRAVETRGSVESVTLVPMAHPTEGEADPVVTSSLWKFADFELRTREAPRHQSMHIVDEFGSVADA